MNAYLPRQIACVPNTKSIWYGRNESDLVVVTKKQEVAEIEIKVSHSDYLADFKKKAKHKALKAGNCIPSKFSYCCQENLIQVSELPPYAGLIWIVDGKPVIKRRASKLHTRSCSLKVFHAILRSACWKYL